MAKREKETRDLGSFEDIMSLTSDDVKEPSLYPTGPWTIRNVGFTVTEVDSRDGNEKQALVNLRYEGFEPGPEVDPEEIEKGGYEGKTLWVRRYISTPAIKASRDGTLARFINFVAMHGLDTDGRNLAEMCKSLKGSQIGAQIGTRSYQNREGETVTDNTVTDFTQVEG